jgi:hypothetical protein
MSSFARTSGRLLSWPLAVNVQRRERLDMADAQRSNLVQGFKQREPPVGVELDAQLPTQFLQVGSAELDLGR